MNYIKHLTGFFDRVSKDRVLNPTHISLYIALFQFWNCNRFKNPISVSRDELMRISKISSKAIYHKCLKNLHSLGYINYEPSYNPYKGSLVYLFNFSDELKPMSKSERQATPFIEPAFSQVYEQVSDKNCTSGETADKLALVSYINNTNTVNNSNTTKGLKDANTGKQAQKIQDDDSSNKNIAASKKEKKLREKKKEDFQDSEQSCSHTMEVISKSGRGVPTITELDTYFLEQNFPQIEGQKFYNYFSSIGWLVGGKTPMFDWQAAAQNWMLNSTKFTTKEIANPDRAKHLNSHNQKNYAEPL